MSLTSKGNKRSPRKRVFQRVAMARTCLGVSRRFLVYLPPHYGSTSAGYPVLYLFRGHEEEWAGNQEGREGLATILDRLIETKIIEPLIVVLPGFCDPRQQYQGIPVDWSRDGDEAGVGKGQFEQHFFEIKALVEQRFQVRRGRRHTALDGFSMGGFSAIFLGLKYPALFSSVGAYDPSLMWPEQIDPRLGPAGRACRLWHSEGCAPFFSDSQGWDYAKMERHNPYTWLRWGMSLGLNNAHARRRQQMRRMQFHVRAAGSEQFGNLDRTLAFDRALSAAGCRNSFAGEELKLAPNARHDWAWADRHIADNLLRHNRVFKTF